MGNCCKIKTTPYACSEPSERHKSYPIGISLASEDNITALSTHSSTWALSQDFCTSLYSDLSLLTSFTTSERIRILKLTSSSLIYGGKTLSILSYNGETRGNLHGHERQITSLDTSGDLLVSGGNDWTIRLWDLNTQQELSKALINWNVVTSVKWQNGSIIQTSEDRRLRVWDIRDMKVAVNQEVNVGDNFANCCDCKGNYIVTGHRGFGGCGCENMMWDIRKMNEAVVSMAGHQEAVQGVKFVKGGIVSCGKDGRVIEFAQTGDVKTMWEHKEKKPFVAMEGFGDGILVGNAEPKVMNFMVDPVMQLVY